MNIRSSRLGGNDLHRLLEDVRKLRLRVTSLEKVESRKLLGVNCGLNLPVSVKTNTDGCSKRKAGATSDARQMPHTAPRIPRGCDS